MKPSNTLIFIFICYSALIKAGTIDSIRTQQINEIEVTTHIKPSATLSSSPLQAISKNDIDRIGILSVSDAIRRMNGVVIKDYGGIGGFKAVAIRGNGAEHTAVLYDGIAVSNAQSGQIDIGQFSLDNVNMLSLIIGQNNNIFLTAKSLASVGVLEINTLAPHFVNKKYLAQVSVKTGSWGLINPYLYYAYKLSSKFSLSADVSLLHSDGRYSFERKNAGIKRKGKRKNTDIDTKRSEINLFGNLNERQKLSLKVYYSDSEKELPGAIILQDSGFVDNNGKERLREKNFFTQAKYINNLSEKFDLQLQGKYSHSYTKYKDEDPKYQDGRYESRYNQNEFYINGTILYKLTNQMSFSFAEDFSFNSLRANLTSFAEPERYSSLTALSGKYETKQLTITGSILGTYISEKVKTGETPDNRKKLSPSVSLSFKPVTSTNLRLRASYKDIFRVPTFNDLYYARLGNTDLLPEKAKQYNMGITWTNRFSNFFDFFSVTGDFFRNSIKDKIIIYPTTFEPKMVNLGKVRITGFDLSTSGQFNLNQNIRLYISGNYSYQKAIDVTNSEEKNYKDRIPYSPDHSGTVSAGLENPWINFSYSVVTASKSYSSTANSDWAMVEGYADHNISLNKNFDFKAYKIRLQADISNILNKTYYIVKDYPMPGRAYRISVNIMF